MILLAVHQDGVFEYWSDLFEPDQNSEFTLGMPDMDYVLGMKTVRIETDADSDGYYTLNILPMIFEGIPVQVTPPFRIEDAPSVTIEGVYLLAILDHNFNGIPDMGEFIGYYSEPYHHTIIPKMIVVTDHTRLDDPVRFTNHTTVGLFHRLIVRLLQILEMLLDLQQTLILTDEY